MNEELLKEEAEGIYPERVYRIGMKIAWLGYKRAFFKELNLFLSIISVAFFLAFVIGILAFGD